MGYLQSPVVFLMAIVSTINYATMQTVQPPTIMVQASPSTAASVPKMLTTTDNITAITPTIFPVTTGKFETKTDPFRVTVDNGKTMSRQVGNDASVTCSASRSGNISVFWIGPFGNSLTNSTKYEVSSFSMNTRRSTLTIFALSKADNGLYTCRASDGAGTTAEDSITLTVYEKTDPFITQEVTTSKQNITSSAQSAPSSTHNFVSTTKQNQTIIQNLGSTSVPLTVFVDNGETLFSPVGSDATIRCAASRSGNISVLWIGPFGNTLTNSTKYGVSSFSMNTRRSTLTIFALSKADSGLYTCRASDGAGATAEDSITLTVYEKTGSDMTLNASTSKQNMITITPASALATNSAVTTAENSQTVIQRLQSTTEKTGSGMTINVTTSRQNMTAITPAAESSTPSTARTTNNQTVIQRFGPTTGTIGAGEAPGMETSKQHILTPENSTTHSVISTMANNQTVTERLLPTTGSLTVSVDNGDTMFREAGSYATITCSVYGSGNINVVWLGPTMNTLSNSTKYTLTSYNINNGKSILIIFALSKTDIGSYTCRATDGSGATAQDVIYLTVHGETPTESMPITQNVSMPSPLMSNSTHDTIASMVTFTSTSLRGFNATTGITSPTMPTTHQYTAAGETISVASMNSTPLPSGTESTTGSQDQSDNCCFSENMVIMLQENAPSVNGYVPFVSILEQTNGTEIDSTVCDAKVLLKATFKRTNRTDLCESCTSFPRCENQMLKIDLWMSPKKHRFSFHVGDSSTNDGYGGDNNTQEHDAEFHLYNYEQRLYGSEKCLNMSQHLFGLPNNSAHWVTIYIGNEFIRVSAQHGDAFQRCSKCLFALNGQADSQGAVNEDIYIGLNRIIRSSNLEAGYGVCGAVISWACPWKT